MKHTFCWLCDTSTQLTEIISSCWQYKGLTYWCGLNINCPESALTQLNIESTSNQLIITHIYTTGKPNVNLCWQMSTILSSLELPLLTVWWAIILPLKQIIISCTPCLLYRVFHQDEWESSRCTDLPITDDKCQKLINSRIKRWNDNLFTSQNNPQKKAVLILKQPNPYRREVEISSNLGRQSIPTFVVWNVNYTENPAQCSSISDKDRFAYSVKHII